MSHHGLSSLRTVRVLLFALLLPGFVFGGSAVARQDTGEAFPAGIIDQDGVDISLLGMESVELPPDAGTYLTLERVTVEPETVFEHEGSPSPALIAGQAGSFLTTDERGFFSHLDAPFQMAMEPGSAPSWTASESATFLRLSLVEKPPVPASNEGAEVEVLASLAMNQPLTGATSLFIATAAFAPDMASVRLDHTGTAGILVETGTVEVLSPSGLEGKLEQGGSIIFPQDTPLNLLGTAGTDATALLFGMTDAPDSTSVLQATATDYCRNIGRDCTAPGTTLANGEAWVGPDARLTLNATTSGLTDWISGRPMTLEFSYANESDANIALSVDAGAISVNYEGGEPWTLTSDDELSAEIAPGDAATMEMTFEPPENAGEGVVVISIPQFGDITGAQWQGQVALSTTTPPGSVLAFGETWVTETSELTVDVRTIEGAKGARDRLVVEFAFTNQSPEPMELQLFPGKISVQTSQGQPLTLVGTQVVKRSLASGESTVVELQYQPSASYVTIDRDTVTVNVKSLEDIVDANWSGANP